MEGLFMYPSDDYMVKLCMSETYDDALSTYRSYVKSLGYHSVSYLFIPRMMLDNNLLSSPVFKAKGKRAKKTKKANQENIKCLNRFKHYAENSTDQNIEKIKKGYIETIDWTQETVNRRKSSQITKKQANHTKKRYEHQLIKGLAISSLAGNKGIGILVASVMSDDNQQSFQQLKAKTENVLNVSTKLFHNHALSKGDEFNVFCEPLIKGLSETEKKVLKVLPTGKTSAVIAKELGTGSRYIDNVIRDLRIKVGGKTADGKPRISTTLLIYYIALTQLLDRF